MKQSYNSPYVYLESQKLTDHKHPANLVHAQNYQNNPTIQRHPLGQSVFKVNL